MQQGWQAKRRCVAGKTKKKKPVCLDALPLASFLFLLLLLLATAYRTAYRAVADQDGAENAGGVRGAPGLADEQCLALPPGEGDHVPPRRGTYDYDILLALSSTCRVLPCPVLSCLLRCNIAEQLPYHTAERPGCRFSGDSVARNSCKRPIPGEKYFSHRP